LALGISLVFAGGQQSGGSGSSGSGSSTQGTQQMSDFTLSIEHGGVNDTTTDIDVSKLTLKGAPGLPGNVKDRLPAVPKLVNEMPKDLLTYQVGKYGGTMRFVTQAVDWDADVFVMCTEPLLNTPGILGKEITGNILRGYTVSDDQKEFTFYLREGLKWSDGVPVTMEDFRFAIEDVMFNTELTPSIANRYKAGNDRNGAPMKFTIVDDWTFKITFETPYGGFLVSIAITGWVGYTDLLKPAHYLKPYHIKYATAADKAKWPPLFREYGFSETDPTAWTNLFHKIDITNWDLNQKVGIGFPNLQPWMLTSANDTVYTYTRNPYYFKIDETGQQLPYVDKLESYRVENMEMVQLRIFSGEVDFSRDAASLVNLPLYKENEKNGFTTYLVPMHVTPTDIGINLTWADGDAEYLSIVRNKKFRHALNKAVDREELIDAIYYGYAEPSTLLADSTFDPAESERLLQEIGMRKGSDGYYRTPSGKNFEIIFEAFPETSDNIPYTELVAEMWKAVGIKTTVRVIERTSMFNKYNANQLQARTGTVQTPLWHYLDWGMGLWGNAWNIYFTNTQTVNITNPDGTTTQQAARGEIPPPEVIEFQSMVNSLLVTSVTEANATYAKLKANNKENLWLLSFIENVKQPLIVNSRIRNIAQGGFGIGIDFSGEMFWFDN
jgi:peptide/nickel transport system substrate-binding protein